MSKHGWAMVIAGAVGSLLGACGSGGGGGAVVPSGTPGAAALTTTLRDAATDGLVAANVVVTGVSLVNADGATVQIFPPANGPAAELDVELLSLRHVSRMLGRCSIPPGRYVAVLFAFERFRTLAVGASAAVTPAENAAAVVRADLPSAVAVDAGGAAHLDIDFDVDASLSGGGGFNPVVHCILQDGDTSTTIGEAAVVRACGTVTEVLVDESALDITLIDGAPLPALGMWLPGGEHPADVPTPVVLGNARVYLTAETSTVLPDGSVFSGNGPSVMAVFSAGRIVRLEGALDLAREGGAIVARHITLMSADPEPERFQVSGILTSVDLGAAPPTLAVLSRVAEQPVDPAFMPAPDGSAPEPGKVVTIVMTPETRVLGPEAWMPTVDEDVLPWSVLRAGGGVTVTGAWSAAGFAARIVQVTPQSIAGTVVSTDASGSGLVVQASQVDGIPVSTIPAFSNPVRVVLRPPSLPADPMQGGSLMLPTEPAGPAVEAGRQVLVVGAFSDVSGAFVAWAIQVVRDVVSGSTVSNVSNDPAYFELSWEARVPLLGGAVLPGPVAARIKLSAATSIVVFRPRPDEPVLPHMGALAPTVMPSFSIETIDIPALLVLLRSGGFRWVEAEGHWLNGASGPAAGVGLPELAAEAVQVWLPAIVGDDPAILFSGGTSDGR